LCRVLWGGGWVLAWGSWGSLYEWRVDLLVLEGLVTDSGIYCSRCRLRDLDLKVLIAFVFAQGLELCYAISVLLPHAYDNHLKKIILK